MGATRQTDGLFGKEGYLGKDIWEGSSMITESKAQSQKVRKNGALNALNFNNLAKADANYQDTLMVLACIHKKNRVSINAKFKAIIVMF